MEEACSLFDANETVTLKRLLRIATVALHPDTPGRLEDESAQKVRRLIDGIRTDILSRTFVPYQLARELSSEEVQQGIIFEDHSIVIDHGCNVYDQSSLRPAVIKVIEKTCDALGVETSGLNDIKARKIDRKINTHFKTLDRRYKMQWISEILDKNYYAGLGMAKRAMEFSGATGNVYLEQVMNKVLRLKKGDWGRFRRGTPGFEAGGSTGAEEQHTRNTLNEIAKMMQREVLEANPYSSAGDFTFPYRDIDTVFTELNYTEADHPRLKAKNIFVHYSSPKLGEADLIWVMITFPEAQWDSAARSLSMAKEMKGRLNIPDPVFDEVINHQPNTSSYEMDLATAHRIMSQVNGENWEISAPELHSAHEVVNKLRPMIKGTEVSLIDLDMAYRVTEQLRLAMVRIDPEDLEALQVAYRTVERLSLSKGLGLSLENFGSLPDAELSSFNLDGLGMNLGDLRGAQKIVKKIESLIKHSNITLRDLVMAQRTIEQLDQAGIAIALQSSATQTSPQLGVGDSRYESQSSTQGDQSDELANQPSSNITLKDFDTLHAAFRTVEKLRQIDSDLIIEGFSSALAHSQSPAVALIGVVLKSQYTREGWQEIVYRHHLKPLERFIDIKTAMQLAQAKVGGRLSDSNTGTALAVLPNALVSIEIVERQIKIEVQKALEAIRVASPSFVATHPIPASAQVFLDLIKKEAKDASYLERFNDLVGQLNRIRECLVGDAAWAAPEQFWNLLRELFPEKNLLTGYNIQGAEGRIKAIFESDSEGRVDFFRSNGFPSSAEALFDFLRLKYGIEYGSYLKTATRLEYAWGDQKRINATPPAEVTDSSRKMLEDSLLRLKDLFKGYVEPEVTLETKADTSSTEHTAKRSLLERLGLIRKVLE